MLSTATYLNGNLDLLAPENGFLGQLAGTLSPESRSQFIGMAQLRQVPARTVLVEDGQKATEIGFVLSGLLAATKHFADGRVSIGALLLPTDLYGRLISGASGHCIEALTEAHVLSFKRAPFQALLLKEPEATQLLLLHSLDELDAAREWTLLLNGSRVVQRVALFLVLLVRRQDAHPARSPQPVPVHVDLSRDDLASYLGTRPETLSRAFHDLADRQIIRIRTPMDFEILDLPALLDLSGQELAGLEQG
jgi:CRP/FNR family transcriptional regulator, anaerobic regulatory protein